MDGWNQGWNDPREFEQQSYNGELYQQWEPYTQSHMPFNHICALCGSPQHSPLDCVLIFEYPEFMQKYEYEMSMHQETMASQAYPQEEGKDESLRSLLQEAIAEMKASNARMDEEIDQLKLHYALEQSSTTLQEPQIFLDQVESTSNEEVYIEHHEQEFSIQVQDDDIDIQEEPLGYGSRQMSKEEMKQNIDGFVQFWKARGLVVKDNLEEDDEYYEEKYATNEAMHHDPSTNEVKTLQDEESPSMPCHEEEVEESRIFLPPPSKEHHQEFPKEQDRTLSTHVHNEKGIEIKVLLPFNPPFSAQCFYDEVKDWKGSGTLVHNLPSHSHIPLPPTPSPSIKSTPTLKEESRRILGRSIAKKRKIRSKPLLWSNIGEFMDLFCSCLYDTSSSPLAPNSTVVLHKKYPP